MGLLFTAKDIMELLILGNKYPGHSRGSGNPYSITH
jgi:hypothetical protein